MSNLFDSLKTDDTAGFRLMYAEFFNWGTFSNTINGDIIEKPYRITPNASTVALQGKKASGKSTLVDGLITLLVPPPRQKHLLYNQASGTSEGNQKSKGRTAETYFWGNYNEILDENENFKAKTLREIKDNHHTILLACFDNGIQRVTLAQVWFWKTDEIQKVYLVAPKALKIEEHFSNLSYTAKEIRKQLEILGPETKIFTDDFKGYQLHFRDIFGIKSEDALKLFHKIIGSKELGSVDNVVKTFILQDGTDEINTRIEDMYRTNDSLINIKKMMIDAERQLVLLNPIISEGEIFRQLSGEIFKLETLIKQLPNYMNLQREKLLTISIKDNNIEIQELGISLDEIKNKLENLQEEKNKIKTAKDSIDIQKIIETKVSELAQNNEKVKKKKDAANEYEALIQELDYPSVTDNEKIFKSNYKKADTEKNTLDSSISAGDSVLTDLIADQKVLEPKYQAKIKELQDLQKNPNNIPRTNRTLRDLIIKELGIKETEIPFIGELIQVKNEHKNWEEAIEKLLRSIALNILVPEKFERKVNRFVSQNNMKGLITYKSVLSSSIRGYQSHSENGVFEKLDLKGNEPFLGFLKHLLIRNFDYECFEEENDFFKKSDQGITITGLQNNKGNYRKDDRELRPILGWDTFANIEFVKEEAEQLFQQKQTLSTRIQNQSKELSEQRTRLGKIHELLKVELFSNIDFRQDEKDVFKLSSEIKKLQEIPKNKEFEVLQTQLRVIEGEIKSLAKEQLEKNTKKSNLETRNETYQKNLEKTKEEIKDIDFADIEPFIEDFESYFSNVLLNAETFDLQQERAKTKFIIDLQDRVNKKNGSRTILEADMKDYLREFPSSSLFNSAESLEGFEKQENFIRNEDLPKYKQEFELKLKDDFTDSFTNFKVFLEEDQLLRIDKDRVETNKMLELIKFDSNLYIQLEIRESGVGDDIKDFRKKLKEILEGGIGINNDQAVLQTRFNKIQTLLEGFKSDSKQKQRLTDVRNWISVHVNKYKWGTKISAGVQRDAAAKSGGQQTELTYTILASAIARQFGLNNNNQMAISKSFRFVILDEAFSKLDNETPASVMQMFKDLRLQLMVIIPDRDKLNAIPDYLGWIHFVSNNEEKNKSEISQIELNYNPQKLVELGE